MAKKVKEGLVKARAELKLSYTHVGVERKKGEKTIGASKKSSGKVVKTFLVTALESSELAKRVKEAIGVLQDGSKGLSKTDTRKIEVSLKKELKIDFDAGIEKLTAAHDEEIKNIVAAHAEKIKELEDIIKSRESRIAELVELVPEDPIVDAKVKPVKKVKGVKAETATTPTTPTTKSGDEEAEVDGQPIKPTKP